MGINGKNFKNFKATDGVSAAHDVIAFATAGAKRSVTRRVQAPKVVKLTPENGADALSAGVVKLRVKFDMPMGPGGSWSTTSEGEFPKVIKGSEWSRDARTCTLTVKLEEDRDYAVGLNASHAANFQSKWGVPLEPVVWKFRAGAAVADSERDPFGSDAVGQDPFGADSTDPFGADSADPFAATGTPTTADDPFAGGF